MVKAIKLRLLVFFVMEYFNEYKIDSKKCDEIKMLEERYFKVLMSNFIVIGKNNKINFLKSNLL